MTKSGEKKEKNEKARTKKAKGKKRGKDSRENYQKGPIFKKTQTNKKEHNMKVIK